MTYAHTYAHTHARAHTNTVEYPLLLDSYWVSLFSCLECKVTEAGHQYGGRISYTRSGRKCQRWDSQVPHAHGYNDNSCGFPDQSPTDAANFCRNPELNELKGESSYIGACLKQNSGIAGNTCPKQDIFRTGNQPNGIFTYIDHIITAKPLGCHVCLYLAGLTDLP